MWLVVVLGAVVVVAVVVIVVDATVGSSFSFVAGVLVFVHVAYSSPGSHRSRCSSRGRCVRRIM